MDESKPPSDRLSIVIKWPEETSRQFREGLESYVQDLRKKIKFSFSEQINHDIYSVQEIYTILKEKWKAFTEKYEGEKKTNSGFDRLEDIAGKMDMMREDMKKLTKVMEGFSDKKDFEFISSQIRELIKKSASTVENLEENFTAEKSGLWPEKQLLCQEKACRKAVEEMITELFSHYENLSLRKDRVDSETAQCLSKFVILKQLKRELPKGLNISDLKRNFLKKVLTNFSMETKESFKNYINNDFYIGPSLDPAEDFQSLLEDRTRHIGRESVKGEKKPPAYKESSVDYEGPPVGYIESDNEIKKESTADLIVKMYRMRNFFF